MIYLIRHGQTAWNKSKKFQGLEDIPLDQEGQKQAHLLSTYFEHLPLKRIYTSDLQRAYDTALAIKKTTRTPLFKDERLRELDVGIYTGKTWDDVKSNHARFLSLLEGNHRDEPIPGGESFNQFKDRSIAVFKEIQSQASPDDDIVIVTHGGVIRMIVLHLLGQTLDAYDTTPVDNASITTIRINPHSEKPEIVKINQTPVRG